MVGRRPHAHQPHEDALKAAAATRGSSRALAGAVFHSDHGSVYTSKDYAKLCADLGVTQSMGAVGTSADNALAESFDGSLDREVLQDAACWSDEATCRRQVFRWILRYNTKRRHSWCRYQSPSTYGSRHLLRSDSRVIPSPCPRSVSTRGRSAVKSRSTRSGIVAAASASASVVTRNGRGWQAMSPWVRMI